MNSRRALRRAGVAVALAGRAVEADRAGEVVTTGRGEPGVAAAEAEADREDGRGSRRGRRCSTAARDVQLDPLGRRLRDVVHVGEARRRACRRPASVRSSRRRPRRSRVPRSGARPLGRSGRARGRRGGRRRRRVSGSSGSAANAANRVPSADSSVRSWDVTGAPPDTTGIGGRESSSKHMHSTVLRRRDCPQRSVRDVSERFDLVVVGGGTAGCVLASRLSEDAEPLGVSRRGRPGLRAAGCAGAWPADMLDARSLPMTHLWEQEPEDRSTSRARIIGGCSAHNACAVVWGSRADYDEWGPGWSFAELEPCLRRAEAMLRVRSDRSGELTPWHEALLAAAPSVGIPLPRRPQRPGRHRRCSALPGQRGRDDALECGVRIPRSGA